MNERSKVSAEEQQSVDEKQNLSAPLIYEAIRQEGIEELKRPFSALWWSGIAAGLGISFSVFSEGFLHQYLPDAEWRPLVENLGYTVGFVIVIFARFQLFTENTLTPILPLLITPNWANLSRTTRLWLVVFLANMVGTFTAALAATYGSFTAPDHLQAFLAISHHFAEKNVLDVFISAIPAGFIIAMLVWILPNADSSKFILIVLLTYIVALGDFAHVVAGSTEVFLLTLAAELTFFEAIFAYILPALAGNIIGGTGLFALIVYAQVREEL